jgi:hypothetical protein
MYGEKMKFKHLQWPETSMVLESEKGRHIVFMGDFECAKIPLVCHVVHLIRENQI